MIRHIKAFLLLIVVGIAVAALNDSLGIKGVAAFLIGVPFGVVAMLYANHRWKLI